MCKVVNGDILIGNFLIEALNKGRIEVSYKDIMEFDRKLITTLEQDNYATRFSVNSIDNFENSYPFFVMPGENRSFRFVPFDEAELGKQNFLERLKRNFQMGLPNTLIEKLTSTADNVLGG